MATTCKLKPKGKKETPNETPILKVHCMQNKQILHKNYSENNTFYLFTYLFYFCQTKYL